MAHSGNWNYAVPLEETDGNARPFREQAPWDGTIDSKGVQRKSSAWDLMSDSETTKQRRTSMRASNTAAGRKRSRNQLREKRPAEEKANTGPRPDDSAWIHRDKLAQIEIQEMEAAGIHVRSSSRRSESAGPGTQGGRNSSRSVSRPRRPASRARREQQEDITNDEDYAAAYPTQESPRKRVSTVPSAPEEEQEAPREREPERYDSHFDHHRDGEFRSPEEVAAELQSQRQYQHQHQQSIPPRPGTSRIPVSRISPVPVPQGVVDRDSPLPRSRAGSQNWPGSFDEMQYARKARSGSISSQVLLDSDRDGPRITPPGSSNKNSSNDENSPPKARIPKKATPAGRKTSSGAASSMRPGSSHQNGRATSTQRPGSSSGRGSRLSNGHYPPEGDAPWISAMYKPDPRLPPDEQMLPTHKKRMMQEQWEKEGKTGTVYDRNFNLLNDEQIPPPKQPILSIDSTNLAPPPRSPSPQKDNQPSPNGSAGGGPWPLSPMSPKSDSTGGSARPGTSGGYKITPTIPSTPTFQRSPIPSPAPQPLVTHNTTPRVPDLDEKEEAQSKKKGCCCIVM